MLLLLTGCAAHAPIALQAPPAPDPVVVEAQTYVDSINSRMPMWDADTQFAKFERAEIDRVKADIADAHNTDRHWHFLEDVAKLHEDWDALVALDEMLQRSYAI